MQDLATRGVGLRVLSGQGAQVDTTTAGGRLVFGIFAALAEFERELIRERTVAGLEAARARGRKTTRTSSSRASSRRWPARSRPVVDRPLWPSRQSGGYRALCIDPPVPEIRIETRIAEIFRSRLQNILDL